MLRERGCRYGKYDLMFTLKLCAFLYISSSVTLLKVTAKTLSQHDELMKKTETMNVLMETNKMLRDEKERLEQEMQQTQAKVKKKADWRISGS